MDTAENHSDGRNTATKSALPLHIEQRNNPTTERLEYHCTICQKTFHSRTQKYYHYACNDDELKKYKCELCEKAFATRSHLSYHVEKHNAMTYYCQDCKKSFSNRMVLQKHLKIHQRTATHLCTHCNKEFVNKETLAAHKARHNNELNFACNICSIKYATKSALEQHRLSHFAKKHECPQCGKRFQRNSILSLHLKRHTKTDIHFCAFCSKKFSDTAALQRHMKMHQTDGITKYRCTQCDIITARKDNMQRHVRNMHTGEAFSDCVDILLPTEEIDITADSKQDSSTSLNDAEFSDRYMPKTVENSSVIKCVGNVEPVKVPNSMPQNSSSETNEPQPVKEAAIRPKKVKKKYDPIEMYRKIIGTEDDGDDDENVDEQTESELIDEQEDIVQIEKPRSTTLNMSNFSETHWRKNFKYTYQHQEY